MITGYLKTWQEKLQRSQRSQADLNPFLSVLFKKAESKYGSDYKNGNLWPVGLRANPLAGSG